MTPKDFQRVLWINLPRRTDRHKAFLERLDAVADWPFRTPECVDGLEMEPPPWWRSQPNAYGIMRAHLAIYHTCLCLGVKRALILEDDCVFCPDFSRKVTAWLRRVPSDWELLYIGGNHWNLPERLNKHVLRGRGINATYAYGITSLGMLKLFRALQLIPRLLADPNCHIDTLFVTLQELGKVKAYCPPKFLIGQAAGPSDRLPYQWDTDQFFQLPDDVLNKLEPVPC